jgi:hypothetical protein
MKNPQISRRGRAATDLLSRERDPEPERRRSTTDFTDYPEGLKKDYTEKNGVQELERKGSRNPAFQRGRGIGCN